MNFFSRISNLYKLSAYRPTENTGDLIVEEQKTAVLVKKPDKKAVFIPRIKKDPVKEITEQPTHE